MNISNNPQSVMQMLTFLSKAMDSAPPPSSNDPEKSTLDPLLQKIKTELTRILGEKIGLSEALKDPKLLDILKNQLPKQDALFSADTLKNALAKSGIQFENQLGQGKVNPQDLKAQLFKLLESFPALKAVINQISEQQLKSLISTDSLNLQDNRIEMALVTPSQTLQNFSFNFFKEYQHETERDANVFEFETQFDSLGHVQGRVSHSQSLIDVRVWLANSNTYQALTQQLNELRDQLQTTIEHNNIRVQVFMGYRQLQVEQAPGQLLYQKT